MDSESLTSLLFSSLEIPDERDEEEFLRCGTLRPLDHFPAVDALTRHRVAAIEQLIPAVTTSLPPAARQALEQRRYHTFHDFSLAAKHAQPTRQEDIPYGHATLHAAPTEAAYLAYVQSADPDLYSFFLQRFSVGFCLRHLERHGVIVGQSGSGKSELLVTINEQMLQLRKRLRKQGKNPGTQIIIDPHSDLATQFSRLRHFAEGEDLIYINPFVETGGNRYNVSINPFEQTDTREATINAKVEGLLIAFQSIMGDEFSLSMSTLIKHCLWVLLLKPDTDIHDLLRFMDDKNNSDLVQFGCQSLPNAILRQYFQHYFPQKKLDVTKSAIANKLYSLLSSTSFQRFLSKGKNALDLQALMDSRKVVVIDLNFGQMGESTGVAVGSFFFGLLYYEALRRAQLPKAARIPVYLTIDEYQNFIAKSSDTFEKILTQARKYKLFLLLAQQHLAQSDRSFLKTIRTGTAIKIAGYTSDSDENARLVQRKPEELDQLHVGEFFLKVGRNPTFRLRASGNLIRSPENPSYMDASAWERLLQEQLQTYYQSFETGDSSGEVVSEWREETQESPVSLGTSTKKPLFDL